MLSDTLLGLVMLLLVQLTDSDTSKRSWLSRRLTPHRWFSSALVLCWNRLFTLFLDFVENTLFNSSGDICWPPQPSFTLVDLTPSKLHCRPDSSSHVLVMHYIQWCVEGVVLSTRLARPSLILDELLIDGRDSDCFILRKIVCRSSNTSYACNLYNLK